MTRWSSQMMPVEPELLVDDGCRDDCCSTLGSAPGLVIVVYCLVIAVCCLIIAVCCLATDDCGLITVNG